MYLIVPAVEFFLGNVHWFSGACLNLISWAPHLPGSTDFCCWCWDRIVWVCATEAWVLLKYSMLWRSSKLIVGKVLVVPYLQPASVMALLEKALYPFFSISQVSTGFLCCCSFICCFRDPVTFLSFHSWNNSRDPLKKSVSMNKLIRFLVHLHFLPLITT